MDLKETVFCNYFELLVFNWLVQKLPLSREDITMQYL